MKKLILIILASIASAVVLIGPIMSKVEKPKYIVNFTEEDIESRSYDSMIVAANMLNGALRIYKTELSDREYRAFCETMLTLVDEVHPVHSGVKH